MTARAAGWRMLLVAAAAGGAVACGALLSRGLRSTDLFTFSHAAHRRASVECLTCHEEVYDAKDLAASHLPKEEKCLECHKEKKEQNECGFCHTTPSRHKPQTYPRREPAALHMSHAAHIERVKEDCSRCHAALPEPGMKGTLTPTMDACLDCHNHRQEFNDGKCMGCHTDLKKYPLKPVSAFTHQGNFVREHGRTARASAASCATCHEPTFCSDCHAGTASPKIEIKFPEKVDSDFIHRNDFIGRHGVEAQADPALCRRCHGPSYCDGCHTAQGFTRGARDPRNPHPIGWSFPGSAQFHGPAARRDIASCASCHDQGPRTNCIDCHKVGGVGGNPHPMGWAERHGREEIRTNGMCSYCHL